MKIIHICLTGIYKDNSGYQEILLSRYHAKAGHATIVIASQDNLDKELKSTNRKQSKPIVHWDQGVKLWRLKRSFSIFGRIEKYKGLGDILNFEQPNIIMVHNPQTLELLTVTNYAKKNKDCNVICDIHTDYFNSANNFLSKNVLHKLIWRTIIRFAINNIKKVYGVTPWRTQFAHEMYKIPLKKLDTLVLGADTDYIETLNKKEIRKKIREKLEIQTEDFVLISGGKIDEEKNIHKIIKAMSLIDKPNLKLIIFGSIKKELKKKFEKKIDSDKRIIYIDWIESQKVYDYYLASDMAIFPGTHSVLWEQAVGTGLPAIFKKWPKMDYLDLGGNVKFVHGNDEEEIKNIIREITSDNNEFNNMRKVAQENARKFSYKEIAKQCIEMT